jgi:hypothetical protein
VKVAQEMCRDGTISVLQLVTLLRKWNKNGLISDKELPHILAIYDVMVDATSLKGSSTKVVPVSSDDTTGVDLPAIRKKVSNFHLLISLCVFVCVCVCVSSNRRD